MDKPCFFPQLKMPIYVDEIKLMEMCFMNTFCEIYFL